MAMHTTEFRLGENSAAIKLMLASQSRMELDIAEIRSALAERKGERRVSVYIAGGLGSVAMFLLTLIGRKLGLTS